MTTMPQGTLKGVTKLGGDRKWFYNVNDTTITIHCSQPYVGKLRDLLLEFGLASHLKRIRV